MLYISYIFNVRNKANKRLETDGCSCFFIKLIVTFTDFITAMSSLIEFACISMLVLYQASSWRIPVKSIGLHRMATPLDDFSILLSEDEMQNICSSGVSPVHLKMYNSLLIECARTGNSIEAEKIFCRMEEVTPDQETYEALFKSWMRSTFSLSKKAEEAEAAFNQLLKAGYIPSTEVTALLIDLLGQLNQPEKADQVFDRVSFAGVVCDVSVYNSLIVAWGHSNVGNAALKAEEILRRMEFSGVDPNIQSFEALLSAWCISRRKDSAAKSVGLVQRMVDLNLNPSIEVYERTFVALSERNFPDTPERGMQLLSLMRGRSAIIGELLYSPSQSVSFICYESLISIWLNSDREGASKAINSLVLSMEASSSIAHIELSNAHAALVISLCKSKRSKYIDIATADDLVVKMEERGLNIHPGVHAILVDSWCRQGNPQRAEIALDRLSLTLLSNITSDPVISNSVLTTLLASKMKISSLPWNQVIAAYGASKFVYGEDADSYNENEGHIFLLERAKNAERVYEKLLQISIQSFRERYEKTIRDLSVLATVRPDR
jgi:pentatricopeptide repeat protein